MGGSLQEASGFRWRAVTFWGTLALGDDAPFHKGMPPGTPGFIQGRKAAPSGSLPGVDMAASSLLSCTR
ncbi:hypothetical protein A4R35_21315 [Thermogemmatispora tikiterensis]|uniref:Uncharacterized protein n=1 Tax=Thermogemmatispora tikiterensis TaxID=1825093 RepID=A0A328VS72_9CHLR|nr:hypothetical protein A4R35_21315 [Thermogemmatispora tikiterensis]